MKNILWKNFKSSKAEEGESRKATQRVARLSRQTKSKFKIKSEIGRPTNRPGGGGGGGGGRGGGGGGTADEGKLRFMFLFICKEGNRSAHMHARG